MYAPPHRVVLDTNVVLRAVVNPKSPPGLILAAAEERKIIVLHNRDVLREYRYVLESQTLRRRFPFIDSRVVETTMLRLKYRGDAVREKVQFEFPRDPEDARFIELAIAGKADFLVTDDDDLLTLKQSHSDAARRLRQRAHKLRICAAVEFSRLLA